MVLNFAKIDQIRRQVNHYILVLLRKKYNFALPNREFGRTIYFLTMAHKISPDVCVACGTCQGECPQGAISEGDVYTIDPDLCIDCGSCADACPMGAISPGE